MMDPRPCRTHGYGMTNATVGGRAGFGLVTPMIGMQNKRADRGEAEEKADRP